MRSLLNWLEPTIVGLQTYGAAKYRPGTPNTSMFAFVIVKLVMRVSVKKIYFQMFEQHSPVIKLVL